jgi:hypothetical protein
MMFMTLKANKHRVIIAKLLKFAPSYIFCQISLITGLCSAKEMHETHSYSEGLPSVNLAASHQAIAFLLTWYWKPRLNVCRGT